MNETKSSKERVVASKLLALASAEAPAPIVEKTFNPQPLVARPRVKPRKHIPSPVGPPRPEELRGPNDEKEEEKEEDALQTPVLIHRSPDVRAQPLALKLGSTPQMAVRAAPAASGPASRYSTPTETSKTSGDASGPLSGYLSASTSTENVAPVQGCCVIL